ncbi:ATPase V [Burkholderia cepacia]|uniref:ATPase V n=1 Tax=Burkholderia cepacia TaxID=292 RepID=A0A2S8I1P8_BURCE|nr:FliH/SctL family protein [Burkholderia cepacia]PQP08292.1 ATPase V [Burkholderia cepacia]HDR9511854.1 ATPase V [Burkholderia cepacia]
MYFSVLKDDNGIDLLAHSRVIKASAIAELFDAIDLRQRLRAELEQAELDRQKAVDEARRDGFAKGEQEVQHAISERLQDAHRFLERAHSMFEVQFAHFVVVAVSRVIGSQPEPEQMQSVIRHAYAELGNEIVMRIAVNPDDRDVVETALEHYRPEWKALVAEDTSVARRSCRLESPIAVVEHDFDALISGVEVAAAKISHDAVALMKESS